MRAGLDPVAQPGGTTPSRADAFAALLATLAGGVRRPAIEPSTTHAAALAGAHRRRRVDRPATPSCDVTVADGCAPAFDDYDRRREDRDLRTERRARRPGSGVPPRRPPRSRRARRRRCPRMATSIADGSRPRADRSTQDRGGTACVRTDPVFTVLAVWSCWSPSSPWITRSITRPLASYRRRAEARRRRRPARPPDETSPDELGELERGAQPVDRAPCRGDRRRDRRPPTRWPRRRRSCRRRRSRCGGRAEETAVQAGVVSAAAEEVSRNVQTVAAGAEEMGASIREIAQLGEPRPPGSPPGRRGRRAHQRDRRQARRVVGRRSATWSR